MTTLNPSHNIFREPEGRHAQAVRQADAASGSGSDVDGVDGDLDSRPQGVKRAKRHGRKRVKAAMPPIPDMRFEQSYLLSIRPYLTPRPSKAETAERGPVEEGKESKSLVSSTEQDEVFHWGRQVDVNWKMVAYVTFRDQFLSPMVQGALWGWGTLLLAGTGATIRHFLYPARHVPKGRITGGPGGKISEAGAGSAVGGGGWWRKFVGSWAGAVETATV